MTTFVIQGKTRGDYFIPAQTYGYTAIDAITFVNWEQNEQIYDFVMLPKDTDFKGFLSEDCCPVGSVEFVLSWLKSMGVRKVDPLNIPEELWKFVRRQVCISRPSKLTGQWYIKRLDEIKNDVGYVVLGDKKCQDFKNHRYFMTEWKEDVLSEWRVFILNKKIVGIKNYAGDIWSVPDKDYIENIVKDYNKRCYTLDIMVYRDASELVTDILELHDFFAVGLYGMEDLNILPRMWIATIKDLLSSR